MITANIWQMERHMAGGMARGFDHMGIIARDGDAVAMADRGGDIRIRACSDAGAIKGMSKAALNAALPSV